jgi:hypothetical protein
LHLRTDDATVVVANFSGTVSAFPPLNVRSRINASCHWGGAMQPQTIEGRVERLENRMTAMEQLPERVDALTTRVDGVVAEIALLRTEMREMKQDLIARIDQRSDEVMTHVRMLHEDMIERFKTTGERDARRRRK